MKKYKYRKLIYPAFFILSWLLVSSVSAQETQSDIPEKLLSLAQELGCQTQAECEAAFNANFTKGLELAEKHNIYTAAQKQVAQSFKSEVLSKLQNITEENFEEELIKLAESVLSKPTIARRLNVTRGEVRAAKTIMTEVKNAGVSLDICRRPEESLTREQLIACLKASRELAVKAEIVETYVPKQRIEQIDFSSKMAELGEALARGEYSEVGRNAEEAGLNCLRSGSESLKSCDVIAEKYFGPEGAEQLRQARSNIVRTEDYYKKGLETITLVMPDDREIVGKEAIMATCDRAIAARDLAQSRACGDFAVKNGFVQKEEVEKGLKFLASVDRTRVDFKECIRNPRACEQFVPQEFRPEFDAGNQIFEIMSAEGLDPERCREAPFNPEIGKQCFEGTKRVLPKLKELVGRSPMAARMVADIERGIQEGERFMGKTREFEQTFQVQGGPGGCRTQEECFKYCSDPAHGTECIAFGAKHEIFGGEEAVQRYENYNRVVTVVPPVIFGALGTSTFPGQGPYPGFQPPAGRYGPPGQYPGFTAPGPGFAPPPGFSGGGFGYGGYPGGGAPGPSPECFEAIRVGDFAKAKEICYTPPPTAYPYPGPQPYPQPYPQPGPYPYPGGDQTSRDRMIEECLRTGKSKEECVRQVDEYLRSRIGPPGPICPTVVYPPCPEGQYRPIGPNGCPSYKCETDPNYRRPVICPTLPTVSECPAGEERYVTYSSPECGEYYGCRKKEGPPPSCPSGQYWYQSPGLVSGTGYCKPYEGTTQCDWANQYLKTSTNSCMPKSNCSDPAHPEYSTSECQGVRGSTPPGTGSPTCDSSLIGLLGSECHYMYNDASRNPIFCDGPMTKSAKRGDATTTFGCSSGGITPPPTGQREQIWNALGLRSWIRADADPARIDGLKTACVNVPSGSNIWMPGAGDYASLDFGMPDPSKCQQATACPTGLWWDGRTCVSVTAGQCPSGQYWYVPSSGGAGYCKTSESQTCPTGQYWNGTACVSSGGGCSVYNDQTSCVGASEKCDWRTSGSAGWCQPSTTAALCGNYICESGETTSCPNDCPAYTPPSCPSGQYWYVPPGGGTGYCTASASTACTQELINLLGSECHNMTNAWFNGTMTQYVLTGTTQVKSCASEYISGCSGGTGGAQTCPTGQYWNGTSCVTSPGGPSSCYGGQVWDGTACSCSSGQTWSGSVCQSSTGGGGYSSDPGTACAQAGGTWNASTNYCQMPSGSGGTTSGSTSCPSGSYWSGSSCVPSTTGGTPPGGATDPAASCTAAGGTWTGSTCQMPGSGSFLNPQYILANLTSILNQLTEVLRGLLR